MHAAVWQFAVSLLAVAMMIGMAWKFGFSGQPQLEDEREASRLAASVYGGFVPVAVGIDAERHSALLRDRLGRVVLVAAHGAHLNAWLLESGARVKLDGPVLTVMVGRQPVVLDLGAEAADWATVVGRSELR